MFNTNENVIFGIVYIPPENTSYTSDEAFVEIENEFQMLKLMCLVGDFNARMGNLSDFIDSNDLDDYFFNNIIDLKEPTDIHILDELCIPRKRNSPDSVVNNYSRKLIDIFKNNNVFIYNGSVGKDQNEIPISRNLCFG